MTNPAQAVPESVRAAAGRPCGQDRGAVQGRSRQEVPRCGEEGPPAVSAIRSPAPNAVLLIRGRRYWDWASDDTGGRIPDVVAAPQVEVTRPGPDGEPTTVTIRNPLYSYIFTNDQFRATYFAGIPQAIWNETYRRPEGIPPVSRNDLSSAALASTFTAYAHLPVSVATFG